MVLLPGVEFSLTWDNAKWKAMINARVQVLVSKPFLVPSIFSLRALSGCSILDADPGFLLDYFAENNLLDRVDYTGVDGSHLSEAGVGMGLGGRICGAEQQRGLHFM